MAKNWKVTWRYGEENRVTFRDAESEAEAIEQVEAKIERHKGKIISVEKIA